jgi:hypothetical protein
MRPRILYDLSRQLAILLEGGLRGERGTTRIPVLVCHPLDALEGREGSGSGTLAVLYPTRIVPETRWRDPSLAVEVDRPAGGGAVNSRASSRATLGELRERLRFPPLWVRVRFTFLVLGGTVEDQLGAMTAALRTIHDHPTVVLGDTSVPGETSGSVPGERGTPDERASAEGAFAETRRPLAAQAEGASTASAPGRDEAAASAEADGAPEAEAYPLRLVDEAEGWKELGLKEHVLTTAFEVTIPIPSERSEVVDRVIERELRVEEAAP